MPGSGPWLRQAQSDLLAAQCLSENGSDSLYCQIAAKCQQVLEKSVKAIAAELDERSIVSITIGFDHRIDQYITAMLRTPRENRSVPDHIRNTLKNNRAEISEIMMLAPHRPPSLQPLPRNTEYPFHNVQGDLIAPTDVDVFKKTEVERYLRLAGIILAQARTLITIASLAPR
jgi:hypothetical protein